MDAAITIVGAGPAGLALARELQRRGVRPVLLERGQVGETWARQYQGLRLHALASASGLPGMPLPAVSGPFPSAPEMARYLRAYAQRFGIDVREGVTLEAAEPTPAAAGGGEHSERHDDDDDHGDHGDHGDPPGWRLRTDRGAWHTRRLVMATGIWSAPVEPALPGRERYGGRASHVASYRGPEELAGARVLVVGLGNSGKDVALAAARVAEQATVAVQRGALFVDYPNALTQHSGELWRRLPPRVAAALLRRVRREHAVGDLRWPERPLTEVYPVVGLELVEAVRAGEVRVRPAMTAFTEAGARFADGDEDAFDVIVLCTGYRPALDPLAAHLRWDVSGLPRTDDAGLRALDAPGLYLFGYHYPTLETWLQRLRREAPAAARAIAADVRREADGAPDQASRSPAEA